MKKLSILCGAIAMVLAVGCAKEGTEPTVPTSKGQIFAKISISMPSTRAVDEAGYEGEEYGQACENAVGSIDLVLMKEADGVYTHIATAHVTNPINLGNPVLPTYSAIFHDTGLKTYISNASNPRNVKLFVICNARSSFNGEDFNPVTATFETNAYGSFNTSNRFIMSSEPFNITLPNDITTLLSYDSESHPWDITGGSSVPVERSLARFDYRIVNNNQYEIMENLGGVDTVVGKIELTDMALINERSIAYYIGRTAAKGLSSNPMTLQHVSKATTTYVVTPNSTNLANRSFRYPYSATVTSVAEATSGLTAGYVWTSMTGLSQDDIDEGWTAADKTGYKIWRYVNENTIPDLTVEVDENQQQLQKYTTGVVFKGKILNYNDGIAGYGADEIYAFRNVIYGDLDNLALSAMEIDSLGYVNPDLHYVFDKTWEATPVYSDPPTNTVISGYTCTLKTGQTPAGNGMTVYKNEGTAEVPLYQVYYYYWNRHNDNNLGNKMGPMEFAVVRNNVYKLSVTGISKFGHTTLPDDDPDPVDPDDPDEDEEVYIKVNVAVLPWTVRVNNIEF